MLTGTRSKEVNWLIKWIGVKSNNINTGHGSLALVVLKIDADIDVDIQSM